MDQKIKIGDNEYDSSKLSDNGKSILASLQFTTQRLQELTNMQALLQRAKNSYLETLKQEMLAQKAGYIIED